MRRIKGAIKEDTTMVSLVWLGGVARIVDDCTLADLRAGNGRGTIRKVLCSPLRPLQLSCSVSCYEVMTTAANITTKSQVTAFVPLP